MAHFVALHKALGWEGGPKKHLSFIGSDINRSFPFSFTYSSKKFNGSRKLHKVPIETTRSWSWFGGTAGFGCGMSTTFEPKKAVQVLAP